MNKETQREMFSTGKGDHKTPRDFFSILHEEFEFWGDVAATAENTLLPIFITEKEDALTFKWFSKNFSNPPYGLGVGAWVEKAIEESRAGNLTVMLLAGRVGTKWFHRAVETADEIRFIKGRLTFEGEANVAPFPSILIVWYGRYDRRSFASPYQDKYYWDTWKLRG